MGFNTQKCLRTVNDMLAMLKTALTGCNLSGPLATRGICVTLQIPTGSRDKVPPAPHEAVTDVVMLFQYKLQLYILRIDEDIL